MVYIYNYSFILYRNLNYIYQLLFERRTDYELFHTYGWIKEIVQNAH